MAQTKLKSSQLASSLIVRDQSGNVIVTDVSTIKCTDNTVTNDGSGIVSIDTGGGSVVPPALLVYMNQNFV